jgi:hypothetical protein
MARNLSTISSSFSYSRNQQRGTFMNLFIFDPDLRKSAQYFFAKDPKRARKQIVESTQMIAIMADQLDLPRLYKCNGAPYKVTTHRTHPCTLWVRESMQNFMLTINYTLELCTEFVKRSEKPHACHVTLINWLKASSGRLKAYSEGLPRAEPKFFGSAAYSFRIPADISVYEKYRIYLDNKLM